MIYADKFSISFLLHDYTYTRINCNKAKIIKYMFLRQRPRHLQPPSIQIFITFQVFALINHLYFFNGQFILAAILVGWSCAPTDCCTY